MKKYMRMAWLLERINTRILLAVMLSIVYIFSFSCNRIEENDNSEKNILYLTQKTHNYSVAPAEEYSCTVLDDGIIELIDYSDTEGYLTGHVQKWKYKILGEGTVRILWESTQSGEIIEKYMEIYTFDKNGNYTKERDCLVTGIKYILRHFDTKNQKILGYFIDYNGKFRYYSIDNNLLENNDIITLYNFLFENYDNYDFSRGLDWENLLECHKNLYALPTFEGECEDDTTELYGLTIMGNPNDIACYLIAKSYGDEVDLVSENYSKVIIDIIGEDWDKYN